MKFTALQLYTCTALQLYGSTALRLYASTILRSHIFTNSTYTVSKFCNISQNLPIVYLEVVKTEKCDGRAVEPLS